MRGREGKEYQPLIISRQVRALIDRESADAILGGYSSEIVDAQAQMASSLGVPFINGGGASSYIPNIKEEKKKRR